MSNLYNKVGKITIAGREFSHPPFSFEFEWSQEHGSATKTNAILYNPNDTTISACESTVKGKKTEYPVCTVEAGYIDNSGVVAEGNVKKFDVYRQGNNRILDMEIYDDVEWRDKKLNKVFTDMKASEILSEIAGDRPKSIKVGEDVTIKKIYVADRWTAVKNIVAKTSSHYSLLNGVFTITPRGEGKAGETLLNYDNGLVGIPEKIDREKQGKEPSFSGYKIETLFIYGLELFSIVNVDIPKADGSRLQFKGKVEKCTQRFSTFQDSKSEFEVRTI
jgi:hypothetical protein